MGSVISEHIEVTPGVCGGKPRIAGHRITVHDVVVWHEQVGLSPDEIVSLFPGITLADVYAALAYYHDHMDEVRRQLEEENALASALRSEQLSKVREKLAHGAGPISPG